MMDNDLLEALQAIPPADLDYDDWLKVGMALKNEGHNLAVWDKWSQNDSRYKKKICEDKWASFKGAFGSPVTGATIFKLAQNYGWRPSSAPSNKIDGLSESSVLGWDSEIGGSDDNHTESFSEYTFPDEWHPGQELITYLETLFEPSDIIGYVTDDAYQVDGRWMPGKGTFRRTAGDIIEGLKKHPDDIGAVIGDCKPECGAWIRFNALDGEGVKNENVVSFKYALVESDTMSVSDQDAMYRKLQLPIACLVYSGGKSLHAIVKVDAKNYDEYRQRVEYLYDFLADNGMTVDKQNRNPSRLSRMPGVVRNGKQQRLVDTNIGRASWDDWKDYAEGITDPLPEVERLDAIISKEIVLPDELIKGVLRCGHKMLVSGSSKAGKSFLLMELAIALAEGKKWLGFDCKKSNVLYVNLEIDRNSCGKRFQDIYRRLGYEPKNARNIGIWNLRGKACPLDELVDKVIRRAHNSKADVVIIDPIYKIITGDENNASEMGRFCNLFDKIATETGAAVIYCHHHSKGAQGSKRAMDRASGSGVFARDPDAQLDMIQLTLDDSQINRLADGGATAWRLESSLREFPNFKPKNFWFEHPIHILDETGELEKAFAEGSAGSNLSKSSKRNSKCDDLEEAFDTLNIEGNGLIEIKEIAAYLDVKDPKTIRKWITDSWSDVFDYKNGMMFRKTDEEEE